MSDEARHLALAQNWLHARFVEESRERNITRVYTTEGSREAMDEERFRAFVPQSRFHDFLISVGASVGDITAECERLEWISTVQRLGGASGTLVPVGPRFYSISQKVALSARQPALEPVSFDTFLSHNSEDKSIVRQLADSLVARGLRPWLDERELVPGRDWQEALEEIVQTAKSAAVLVGSDGIGPWQDREMRGCLTEFVDRGLPVIPVLLPGAPKKPELPLFLKAFTWVDLRGGLNDDGLDRLVWGITGKKPSSLASSVESDDSAVGRFVAELAKLAKRKPHVEWLTSIISDCCVRLPVAINDDFHLAPLATCIDEAVQHGIQGEEEAGDRWGKTNSLQAVTLVLVGLAHAIKRSPQSLLLITDACESLLRTKEIELRITWPKDGKDELYRMAVETNDPHDEAVCEFLDDNCER